MRTTHSKVMTIANKINTCGKAGKFKEDTEMMREKTLEEKVAERAQPIITRQVQEMTFAVMGSDYTPAVEKQLYEKLSGEYANMAASDFVVEWCKVNGGFGDKWGCVRISNITHYDHCGSGGHYCITALVEESTKEEIA